MTTTVLVLLILAVAALAGAGHAHGKRRPPRITLTHPTWMTPLVRRLSVCETRGNPRFQSGPYEGIVAWYYGTWDLDKPRGFPDHAYQATLRQQHRVALISLRRHRYFGCLIGPEHAWVRGLS